VDRLLAARERPQGLGRVAAIDPEVACEVVERAGGNRDEWNRPLDRDLCARGQRSAAAGHAQRCLGCPARNLGGVFAGRRTCVSMPSRDAACWSASAFEPCPECGLMTRKPPIALASTSIP